MVIIKNADGSIERSVGGPYYGHGEPIIIKPAKRKKKAKPANAKDNRKRWATA